MEFVRDLDGWLGRRFGREDGVICKGVEFEDEGANAEAGVMRRVRWELGEGIWWFGDGAEFKSRKEISTPRCNSSSRI